MSQNTIADQLSNLRKDIATKPQAPAAKAGKEVVQKPQRPKLILQGKLGSLQIDTIGSVAACMMQSCEFEGSTDLAEYIIYQLAMDQMVKDATLEKEVAIMKALQEVCTQAAVAQSNRLAATRIKRVLDLLHSLPAYNEFDAAGKVTYYSDEIAQGEDGSQTPVVVENVRHASNALTHFKKWYGDIDERLVGLVDTAKTKTLSSLISPSVIELRSAVPDFGVMLLLAAIRMAGYDANERPALRMVRTNFPTLLWIETIVSDFYSIVEKKEDHDVLLKMFFELVSEQVIETLDVANGELLSEQQIDFVRNELTDIQGEVLIMIADLLSFLRFKKAEKEYIRNLDGGKGKPKPERHASKPQTPEEKHKRTQQPTGNVRDVAAATSAVTVNEAVSKVVASTAVEVDLNVPTFNAAALGCSHVTRKKVLKAAGIDGPREVSIYPGVIWEAVIGPMDHAFDFDRTETDLRMVVIAPRRAGAMGLDLSESRIIMVKDYEDFFKPVEE